MPAASNHFRVLLAEARLRVLLTPPLLRPILLWHNELMWRWLIACTLAIPGFVVGASYGRYLFPAEHVDTDPASLRVDYATDYVLMVAERFQSDHDREAALRRLSVLGDNPPFSICSEAIRFAQSVSYSQSDVEMLRQLQRAVQAMTSSAAPPGTSR